MTVESAPIAARSLHEDRVIEVAGEMTGQVPAEYASLFPEPVRLVCAPMAAAGRDLGVIFADRLLSASRRWTTPSGTCCGRSARRRRSPRWRAMVATEAEKSRQLEQRIDLAREIHEGVIQRLFGISMALDAEGDLPADARARCATEIQEALSDLRTAIQRPLGRAPRADPDDVRGRGRAAGSRCTRTWG